MDSYMTTRARATGRGREQNGTPSEGSGAPGECLSKRTEDGVPGLRTSVPGGRRGADGAGMRCSPPSEPRLPAKWVYSRPRLLACVQGALQVAAPSCGWVRGSAGVTGPAGTVGRPQLRLGGGQAGGGGWASSAMRGHCTQGPEPMGWWESGEVREKPEGASGREVCPPEDKARA